MKKQVKIILGAAAAVVLVGLVAARMMKPQEEIQTKGLPAVSVTAASRGDVSERTSLMGTIQPSDTYYVTPKAAGELVEIYVTDGETVHAGDPIAKIDNQKQIDAAKATLDAANASAQSARQQADTAQDALDRMTPLYEAGDIAAQTYQQTLHSANAAQAQVTAAEAQVDSAQLNYDTQREYATVTAPADGIVQSCSMTEHAMVSQSSQLCVITGTGAKLVKFNVTEEMLNNLHLGQTVTVEKNGSSYEGILTKLSQLANAQTGLFPVEAALSGADALADGTSAKLSLVSAHSENALLVPVDCVYYSGGNPYVYTYQDGCAKRTYIETGLSDDENYEVTDGLDGTEQIVSSWTEDIYDGAEVRLLNEDGSLQGDTAASGAAE